MRAQTPYTMLREALQNSGYSRQHASRIAHGHVKPSMAYALVLARNFAIPIEIWADDAPALAYWKTLEAAHAAP